MEIVYLRGCLGAGPNARIPSRNGFIFRFFVAGKTRD